MKAGDFLSRRLLIIISLLCVAIFLTSCGKPVNPSPEDTSSTSKNTMSSGASETNTSYSAVSTETSESGSMLTSLYANSSVPVTISTRTTKSATTASSLPVVSKPTSTTADTTITTTGGQTTIPTQPSTVSTVKDPWRAPYDLAAIYVECQREVERLGVIWDDNLRIDNSGWTGNTSTYAITRYPDMFYLKDVVWDIIHSEIGFGGVKSCRIWFEPYPQYPGDYLIYFLWMG